MSILDWNGSISLSAAITQARTDGKELLSCRAPTISASQRSHLAARLGHGPSVSMLRRVPLR